MSELNVSQQSESGLDTAIKVLTIVKLLIQTALWGIMLGTVIYLLRHNPIPKLIEGFQDQVIDRFTTGG
jgi:hypothetical protein